MARFPGTEVQRNKAGFVPGQVVRFRRSRANASRDLADKRGFVTEVRPAHTRVLLDAAGAGIWIDNESLLPEQSLLDPALEALREAFRVLNGQRLEVDGDEWAIFGQGFDAGAVDAARAILAARLRGMQLGAHGVHELVVRLELAAPGEQG